MASDGTTDHLGPHDLEVPGAGLFAACRDLPGSGLIRTRPGLYVSALPSRIGLLMRVLGSNRVSTDRKNYPTYAQRRLG